MTAPDRSPIFVFDGDCGFCRRWAAWLQGRGLDHVRFAPFHALAPGERAGITAEDLETASYFIDGSGATHRGSDGFIEALQGAQGAWRVAGFVSGLPGARQVARGLYALVARNRHRLPAPAPRTGASPDRG